MGQEESAQQNPNEVKNENESSENQAEQNEVEKKDEEKQDEEATKQEDSGQDDGGGKDKEAEKSEDEKKKDEEKKDEEDKKAQEGTTDNEHHPESSPEASEDKKKDEQNNTDEEKHQEEAQMEEEPEPAKEPATEPLPTTEEKEIEEHESPEEQKDAEPHMEEEPPVEVERIEVDYPDDIIDPATPENDYQIKNCTCCFPTNRKKYGIALKYQSSYYVGHNTSAKPFFPCLGYILLSRPEGIFIGIGPIAYLYLLLLVGLVFLAMFIFAALQCVAFFFSSNKSLDVPVLQKVLPGYVAHAYEAGSLRISWYYWSVAALILIILVLNIGLCVIPYLLKRNSQKTDAATISPADYALYFSGIPQSYSSAKHVYDALRHWGTIDSVMLMFDVTKYAPNQRKLDQMMQGYRTALTTEHRTGESEYPFSRYYLSDEDYILEVDDPKNIKTGWLANKLRGFGLYQDKHYFAMQAKKLCDERRGFDDPSLKPSAGVAVVTFSFKSTALRVITAYRKGKQIFKEPVPGLKVEKHVEPSDIIFENLMSAKNWGAIFFWLILTLAVLIGGVVLKDYLYGVDEENNNTALHVLIIVVNKALTIILAFLVDMFVASLQCQTQTMMALISATLTTIVNFSLSVGLEYFRYISYYGSDYTNDSSLYMTSTWFIVHAQDLAVTVIGDMAITLVLTLLHPVQIVQHVLFFLFAPCLPQVQLNLSLAPPIWSLSSSLSAISTVVLNSCLVGSFFPPVFVVTCIFFIGLFFVDDRNLSVFYRVPPHYSDEALNIFNFFLMLGSVIYTLASLATYFFLPRHTGDMIDDYNGIYVPAILLLTVAIIVIVYWIAYYPSQNQLDKQSDLDDDVEALWEAMHNEQVRRKAILYHQQKDKHAKVTFSGVTDVALRLKRAARKAKEVVKKQKNQQVILSYTEAEKEKERKEEEKREQERKEEEKRKQRQEAKKQKEDAVRQKQREREKEKEEKEKERIRIAKLPPKQREAEKKKKLEEEKKKKMEEEAKKKEEEERKRLEEQKAKEAETPKNKSEWDPTTEMSTKRDETQGVPFPMYAAFITTYVELHPLYADRILQSHEYLTEQMVKKNPEMEIEPLARGVVGTQPPDTYLYTTSVASPEEIPKERRCQSTRQTVFTDNHTRLTVLKNPRLEKEKNEPKLPDYFKKNTVYQYEDTHPPVFHQFFSFYAPRRLRPRRPWRKLPDFEIESEIKHKGLQHTAENLEKIRNWGFYENEDNEDLCELQRLHAAAELFKYPPIIIKAAGAGDIAMAKQRERSKRWSHEDKVMCYTVKDQKKPQYYSSECYIDIVEVQASTTAQERFQKDPPSVIPPDSNIVDEDVPVEELQKKYRQLRHQLKSIGNILQD